MSDWVPTREAWEKFLSLLDPDDERAGEKYESIRKRLIIYFEGRKRRRAEELADRTIIRVIQKHDEGTQIDDVMRYSYGVARNILLEDIENVRREDKLKEELLRSGAAFVDPRDPFDEKDVPYAAFEKCMEKLAPDNRAFILDYYEETGRAKIDNRKSLREQFRISHNAVNLRAYHIRKKLGKCIKSLLKRPEQ
jgi:DNA-directed RNA polymerase specialized sigma24 family protein